MSKIDTVITHLGYLDTLAGYDSPVHRLDPRAKLTATLVFIALVVSYDKYQVSALLPFTLFPIALAVMSHVPCSYLIKRTLWVAPFALLIGLFNPLLDRQTLMQIGSLEISGGWISLASILIRFILTVLTTFILIATTGFNTLCLALRKIGVPNVFVMQLMFLYRYAFVLIQESSRMLRAWQLRAPLKHAIAIRTFSTLAGSLFLRTTGRAQHIYQAMCCRGFDGQIHPARQLHWTGKDTVFLAGTCAVFILMRCTNPALHLGRLITGIFQ